MQIFPLSKSTTSNSPIILQSCGKPERETAISLLLHSAFLVFLLLFTQLRELLRILNVSSTVIEFLHEPEDERYG